MLVSLLELSEVIDYKAKLHFEFSSQGGKREGLMCGLLQPHHTSAKGLLQFLLLGFKDRTLWFKTILSTWALMTQLCPCLGLSQSELA